jgi:hypothetical protein
MSNKKQINVTVGEDLFNLVHKIEEVTGTTSTRFVTACIVKFVFEGFYKIHQAGIGPTPDLSWLQWAMLLERERITVEDIPGAILEDLVADTERTLRMYQEEDERDAAHIKDTKEKIKLAKAWLGSWTADIKEYGGKTAAIDNFLDRIVPRAPGIVNPWRA